MPTLRFTRDKRGYENTFVVHAPRRRGRGRTRILYWFRTPPGVRVGRAPLDEDAIRLIEEHHPDVSFDWQQILSGREEPEEKEEKEPPPERQAPINPAHAEIGSEGLNRLRGRYADVLAAIGRRVPDPQRAEELKTQAERLNPDAWVTADEVRRGLAEYESVLDSLRDIVGRRRRRRRRGGGDRGGPADAASGGADAQGTAASEGESDGDAGDPGDFDAPGQDDGPDTPEEPR